MTNQERLAFLDAYKLCHKCEKNKQFPNRKFCAACLEKITLSNIKRYNPNRAHEYQSRRRELYQEHKANGICVRCSKPATHGLYCIDHLVEAKKRSRKRSQIRKNERHDRGLIPEYRMNNNLCYYCGAPVENPKKHGHACDKCAKEMSEYSMRQDKSYWKGQNDLIFKRR